MQSDVFGRFSVLSQKSAIVCSDIGMVLKVHVQLKSLILQPAVPLQPPLHSKTQNVQEVQTL